MFLSMQRRQLLVLVGNGDMFLEMDFIFETLLNIIDRSVQKGSGL